MRAVFYVDLFVFYLSFLIGSHSLIHCCEYFVHVFPFDCSPSCLEYKILNCAVLGPWIGSFPWFPKYAKTRGAGKQQDTSRSTSTQKQSLKA